jgi:hypothetical protein
MSHPAIDAYNAARQRDTEQGLQLAQTGHTLVDVQTMVYRGQITKGAANEFFARWVKGKCEFRWNIDLSRPEYVRDLPDGREVWFEFKWKESPEGRFTV